MARLTRRSAVASSVLLIACSSVLYLAHDPSFGILEIATIAAPEQLAPLAGQGLRAARKLVVSPLLCNLFSRVQTSSVRNGFGVVRDPYMALHGIVHFTKAKKFDVLCCSGSLASCYKRLSIFEHFIGNVITMT